MKTRIDLIIDFYRAAADAGRRCPTAVEHMQEFGMLRLGEAPTDLARRGLITSVEIYGKNWRVIEIDGKRTAPFLPRDGHVAKPYRIINKDGDNWVGK